MYIAHTTIQQSQIPLYINILKRIIIGQEDGFKAQIDLAITEARQINSGEKSVFSISNDRFFIISKLIENGKEFLANLRSSNYNTEDYKEVLKIIESSGK